MTEVQIDGMLGRADDSAAQQGDSTGLIWEGTPSYEQRRPRRQRQCLESAEGRALINLLEMLKGCSSGRVRSR